MIEPEIAFADLSDNAAFGGGIAEIPPRGIYRPMSLAEAQPLVE
jgi:hypothetical protein